MKFYKLENNEAILANTWLPGIEISPGKFATVSNPDDQEYINRGYLTLNIDPPNPPDGMHVVTKTLKESNGTIIAEYTYENDPPRNLNLSKRKLMVNLRNKHKWDQVKAWIEQSEIKDDWETATTLDELDPKMQQAIQAMPQLGLTNEEIEDILVSSAV